MILKLLLTVLLLYYIGVLWKYYRADIAGMLGRTEAENETDKEGEADEEAKKRDEPYTVIGKSTYRKGQTYEPEAKRGRTENQADKTDNFALETSKSDAESTANEAEKEPETATENPSDKGTEQAEENATGQTNETAADDDADYSDIEVDPDEDEPEEEEYVPTPEEMEEEEELGAYYPDGTPEFATGYTFEDLKKVHRIMTTDDTGEEEKRQAREVLPAVMGSDIWDKMMDEFEGARQRVARLMNNSNV